MATMCTKGQETRVTIIADLEVVFRAIQDIKLTREGGKSVLLITARVTDALDIVKLDAAEKVLVRLEIASPDGGSALGDWQAAEWRAIDIPGRSDYVTVTISVDEPVGFVDSSLLSYRPPAPT